MKDRAAKERAAKGAAASGASTSISSQVSLLALLVKKYKY
jgi:hypothetical protein